jgi:hypothetical protein
LIVNTTYALRSRLLQSFPSESLTMFEFQIEPQKKLDF